MAITKKKNSKHIETMSYFSETLPVNNYKKLNFKSGVYLYNFPVKLKPVLAEAARKALSNLKPGVINIILVNDASIKKLNKKYRKVDRITDVISFLSNSRPLFGDIYISRERSRKQAKRYGNLWQEELAYLVIHGILHLFGYKDYAPADRKKMFKKQDSIFKAIKKC